MVGPEAPLADGAPVGEANGGPASIAPRPAPDVDLRRVINPSAMTDRPGFVMRLLSRMFDRVSFDLRHQARINEAARRGRIVYVCDRQSILDYLYFNYAFLKLALPLVWFANGVRALFLFRPLFRALGYLLRRIFRRVNVGLPPEERLAVGVQAGRANLVFLRRRRALVQWGGEQAVEFLRRLVELQPAADQPILLVPLMVFWEKDPERYSRSLADLVFGAPTHPGRLRKLIGFLRFYRHALVQVGEPIALDEFIAEHRDGTAPEILAERLRFSLHRGINQATRPIRGPVLKRAKRIRDEMLRADAFRQKLERFAEDANRPLPAVLKEARGYLDEIAADFHIRYVEGFCVLLTVLWNRLFSGFEVDQEGLHLIREAAQDAPIIFVPAHRSHIDYLAISYICYTHGLIPPHIAAGINLSFWPMGHIFRRSGAFFLRRSFKGNKLYAMTFQAYVRKIVKEGYWIEFFIEGGRSRTGKCLPPRMGILGNVVDAVIDGAARDVCLVPVSIGYERVVEEGAYSRELSGAEKEAENLSGLLKTTKVLKSRYGRLQTSFGAPVSLRRAMEEKGFDAQQASEPELRRFVNRLGHRLIADINDATAVTTTALVATALLCHPKRGMSRARLRMRVGLLLEIATRQGATLATALRVGLQARRLDLTRAEARAEAMEGELEDGVPVPRYQRQRVIDRARGEAVREAIDEALSLLASQKVVRAEQVPGADGGETVFTPIEEKRITLDIYKNNLIHRLVPHGFAATAILAAEHDGRVDEAGVRRHVHFLSRLLKNEFIWRDRGEFDAAFAETRQFLFDLGLLTTDVFADPLAAHSASLHPKARHLLRFFRNVTANFLQSYRFVALRLPDVLAEPANEKDVLKRLQQEGVRAFREGDLTFREAVSSVNFQNAIGFFTERGFVVRDGRRLSLRRPRRHFQRWADHIALLLRE